MKTFTSILSIVLIIAFCVNYPLAEYMAPWSVNPDRNLVIRFNIYAFIMFGCAIIYNLPRTSISKFSIGILIGLTSSDVIDRCRGIYEFNIIDVLAILLGIALTNWKQINGFYVKRRNS